MPCQTVSEVTHPPIALPVSVLASLYRCSSNPRILPWESHASQPRPTELSSLLLRSLLPRCLGRVLCLFHSPAARSHRLSVSWSTSYPSRSTSFSAARVGPKSQYSFLYRANTTSLNSQGLLLFDVMPRLRCTNPLSPSLTYRLYIRRPCRHLI